jgi:CRP-like cAMP-binding protein
VTAQDTYLRAILATVARQTFAPARLVEIIGQGAGDKQHRAFNLCDGSRSQAEIAKELGLDQSNFSKTLNRWVDEGIVVRVGDKRDARPLHVYPLPEAMIKKASRP